MDVMQDEVQEESMQEEVPDNSQGNGPDSPQDTTPSNSSKSSPNYTSEEEVKLRRSERGRIPNAHLILKEKNVTLHCLLEIQ